MRFIYIVLVSTILTSCALNLDSAFFSHHQQSGHIDSVSNQDVLYELIERENQHLLKVTEKPDEQGKQEITAYEIDGIFSDYTRIIMGYHRSTTHVVPGDEKYDDFKNRMDTANQNLKSELFYFKTKHRENPIHVTLTNKLELRQVADKTSFENEIVQQENWVSMHDYAFSDAMDYVLEKAKKSLDHIRKPQNLKVVPNNVGAESESQTPLFDEMLEEDGKDAYDLSDLEDQ